MFQDMSGIRMLKHDFATLQERMDEMPECMLQKYFMYLRKIMFKKYFRYISAHFAFFAAIDIRVTNCPLLC